MSLEMLGSCGRGSFMLILAIGNHFLPQSRSHTRQMLGHDFLVFYSGGTLARTGQYHKLYNMDTLRRMEHATGAASNLEMGNGFGPWWNPPHAAWMFLPVADVHVLSERGLSSGRSSA